MPSHLRYQSSLEEPIVAISSQSISSPASPPLKKQKMSLTQTYFVASQARTKLGREAARPDHNLRLLVGHANLLDSLMLELADAEQEQEAWFNETVRKADKEISKRSHIQWVDTISEDEDEEQDDDASETSDSDSENDVFDEDVEMAVPLRRIRSPPAEYVTAMEIDDEDYEDFEYDEEHALTRTSSHPPDLVDDSDSEDESQPLSPPQPSFELSEKQRQAITTTALFSEEEAPATSLPSDSHDSFIEDGYFIPQRNAPMIEVAA
ncbi:hypothetical protein EV356DRAFT_87182 [Viridothelium virens]|uniref:Uncharacterized protein n=1 Tax=Viridothelium virens TaxID=1048519 RepID=A0A6A6HF64_VIRVR|nr:hypothetical protein EV356DRAFT_87182 [Viridothelium virens]